MNSHQRTINELAQGIKPWDEGIVWFENANAEERDQIMRAMDLCIFQSHPTTEEIEQGIAKSHLKPTYSPCIVVVKKHFNEARQKILGMRGIDQMRAFQLFLAIFSVADQRRRETECTKGCSHEWHNLENA